MLTIGPKLCKDKLVQAAGRLRQLEKGRQTVFLVGPESVTEQIASEGEEITAADVLQWTMQNTIAAVAHDGLTNWAKQGVHFCFTQDNPDHALVDEVLDLSHFYGKPFTSNPVVSVINETISSWRERRNGKGLKSSLGKLLEGIKEHIEGFGAEYEVMATGLDEECKRELEKEVEQEEEREVEMPRRDPMAESDWDYGMIFKIISPSDIPRVAMLTDLMKDRFNRKDKLHKISWARAGEIYATKNFIETVKPVDGKLTMLSQYLRPLDAMVTFQRNESAPSILLLSEREADAILQLFWERGSSSQKKRGIEVQFVNLTYARLCHARPSAFTARGLTWGQIPSASLVGLQLLAGETKFETDEQKDHVRAMTSTPSAKMAALKLPGMRGLQFMVSRSDLDIICT